MKIITIATKKRQKKKLNNINDVLKELERDSKGINKVYAQEGSGGP